MTVGPNILYPTATITTIRYVLKPDKLSDYAVQPDLKGAALADICVQGRLSNATLVTDVVTGTEPRKLSSCRRHEMRFGVFYLSHSTSCGVNTAITCRRAPGCWVVIGDW